MQGKIYLIDKGDQLRPMAEEPYAREELLQRLLEDYPDLLAGEQIDQEEPRRWLLISREMGVPAEEDGGGRWSLDHLFVDQDGIPTLVEVKRSSDTRTRREVVAQMLDYAANAIVHWPIETIRTKFENNCEKSGKDAEAELTQFLDNGAEDVTDAAEAFWSTVRTNLQAGKIRMVFVADRIPPELQRIIEFLNEQMEQVEVLAVELRQFVGEGVRTLVPRVLGLTASAQQKKSVHAGRGESWDEKSFMADLRARRGEGDVQVATSILRWLESKDCQVHWGDGRKYGTYAWYVKTPWGRVRLINVYSGGYLYLPFGQLKQKVPSFADTSKRRDFADRLRAIKGVSIPEDAIDKYPTIYLSVLADSERRKKFCKALEWLETEIRSVQPLSPD